MSGDSKNNHKIIETSEENSSTKYIPLYKKKQVGLDIDKHEKTENQDLRKPK